MTHLTSQPSSKSLGMDSQAKETTEADGLTKKLQSHFIDFRREETSLSIFSPPFHGDVEGVPVHLQMELIEPQEDLDLKVKFQDIHI